MLICSWNIFGIKAHAEALKKAFHLLRPDVFCLVEVKTGDPGTDLCFDDYHRYWNEGKMSNMNGVAVYSKTEPISVIHDNEDDGRLIALEFDSFFVVCTYVPYSNNSDRLLFRLSWNKYYESFINELQMKKPVICCGDFNVVRTPEDAWDAKIHLKRGCFYEEERSDFQQLLDKEKLIDVYRKFYTSGKDFTYWPYSVPQARTNNQGYRIDYFLVSRRLMENVIEYKTHTDIMGSCSCPISLLINE